MRLLLLSLGLAFFPIVSMAGDSCSTQFLYSSEGYYNGCSVTLNGTTKAVDLSKFGCQVLCMSASKYGLDFSSIEYKYRQDQVVAASTGDCQTEKIFDKSGGYKSCRATINGTIRLLSIVEMSPTECEKFCVQLKRAKSAGFPSNTSKPTETDTST